VPSLFPGPARCIRRQQLQPRAQLETTICSTGNPPRCLPRIAETGCGADEASPAALMWCWPRVGLESSCSRNPERLW